MSEWKEILLGDVIEIINGFAFKSSNFLESRIDNSLPVIKIKNVANGDVHLNGCQFHPFNQALDKFVIEKGDVLIALTGNHPEVMSQVVGEVSRYKLNERAFLNQRVAKVLPKENKNVANDFLYYFLKDDNTHDYLASQSTGSANQANISKIDIENIPITLPPLPEQTAIAEVLCSFDDKIDLLNRQNKTLEQLAETLFKQWFVEKAEESWEIVRLETLGKIICGKTPSKKNIEFFNGEIPFIKIPDMHGKTFVIESEDSLTELGLASQSNKTIPPKSICVSCIATVGLVIMNAKTSQTNQQINSIVPAKDIYRYFLYLKMLSLKNELLAMASGGTATDNLNTGDFSRIEIALPNEVLLNEFDENVSPMFEKIFTNQAQIRTLKKLRNTLLRKLMSGEVTINN